MPAHQTPVEHIDKPINIRNIVIELLIYGVLVTVYALVVLRWLGKPLHDLFHSNLTLYAFVGLALIVGQGVLLERLTAFLIERFNPHQ